MPLTIAALLLSSCGGGTQRTGSAPETPSPRSASPAAFEQAPAPAAAGALALVPDSRAAATRLGYADRARLRSAGAPVTLASVVLGPDAGAATVAVGARRKPFTPADPPQTNAINPEAQSAVQSCLGDSLAQTVLGPAASGPDAAIGAGVATTGVDARSGLQLRVCGAPRLIRDLAATTRALRQRFGRLAGTRVRTTDVGERQIVAGTIPAAQVDRRTLRRLLAGGDALRALAPWR